MEGGEDQWPRVRSKSATAMGKSRATAEVEREGGDEVDERSLDFRALGRTSSDASGQERRGNTGGEGTFDDDCPACRQDSKEALCGQARKTGTTASGGSYASVVSQESSGGAPAASGGVFDHSRLPLRWCGPIQVAFVFLALLAAASWDRAAGNHDLFVAPLVAVPGVVLFAVRPVTVSCSVKLDMKTASVLIVVVLLLAGMPPRLLWDAPIGTEALCPLQVMVIFYGMAYLCLSVNQTGFLKYIALRMAEGTRSQGSAFAIVGVLTAVLTLMTSNDVVILSLTPIIIHMCDVKGYDPYPFLVLQFVSANVWSISLLIGNPTNVIAAGPAGLSFDRYVCFLAPSGVTAGLVSLAVIRLRFRGELTKPAALLSGVFLDVEAGNDAPVAAAAASAPADEVDWVPAYITGGRLLATLVFASLDALHGVPLWVAVAVAGSAALVMDGAMGLAGVGKARTLLRAVLGSLPWEVFPFVMSLFIVVQALDTAGIVGDLAGWMAIVAKRGPWAAIGGVGVASILACQVLNNQPMTVLFAKVLSHSNFDVGDERRRLAFGALIIGSNLGANLTLVGALAGPMWVKVCKLEGVEICHCRFITTMATITPFVACGAFTALAVVAPIVGEAWP